MNSWLNKIYKKIIKEVDGEHDESRSEEYQVAIEIEP